MFFCFSSSEREVTDSVWPDSLTCYVVNQLIKIIDEMELCLNVQSCLNTKNLCACVSFQLWSDADVIDHHKPLIVLTSWIAWTAQRTHTTNNIHRHTSRLRSETGTCMNEYYIEFENKPRAICCLYLFNELCRTSNTAFYFFPPMSRI